MTEEKDKEIAEKDKQIKSKEASFIGLEATKSSLQEMIQSKDAELTAKGQKI